LPEAEKIVRLSLEISVGRLKRRSALPRIYCGAAIGGRYGINARNASIIAEAGVERVEIPFAEGSVAYRDKVALADAARLLAAESIVCRSVHLGFETDYDISSLDDSIRRRTVDDMKYGLSVAPILGAGMAVVHASSEPISDGERPQRMAAAKESLKELCDVGGRHGVRLALELLPRTCLGNTSAEALEIAAGLSDARIGFCVDVNHVNLREEPADAVRALGKRILTFHISDNDGIDERHWFPFEGVIDWQSFMSAVKEIGYGGQFILETSGSLKGDPRAYLDELRARFDRLMAL
jgi:sugar phosphate isomerase/epimerase